MVGILHTFKRADTAARTHLIGASAAPVILGLSPWQTPMGLWLHMQQGAEIKDNPAMKRGRFLEPALLAWTAAEVGAVETEPGIPLHEPGIAGPEAWAQFHPDGALRMPDGAWRLAEIKTSRMGAEWGEEGTDEIPLHYLAQVQFQLACCPGIAEAQVGVYLPMADRLKTFVVESDPDYQAFMFNHLSEWVYRHIVLGEAPPIDGSKAAATYLRDRHPQQLAPIRGASPYEAELVAEFAAVKRDLKALETRQDELANQLKAACGDAEGLSLPDVGKVTWRHVSGAERVDVKRLRAEFPDVWATVAQRSDDRRDLRFWPSN